MAQSVLAVSAKEPLRVRRSFRDVEKDHFEARQRGETGPTELETLVRAWQGIQELDPKDLNSFFTIAGYHGEPFRGAGWSNPMWWGGYCYHSQILFPTWHRAYVLRLETALRSIKGCENVSLPFLDWCDGETQAGGLPQTFTMKDFSLGDGISIKNPLYSYVFQKEVFDALSTFPDTDYSKPKDYETVRYPLSGLVGLPQTDQASITKAYNDTFAYPENVKPLNDNVKSWLSLGVPVASAKHVPNGTAQKFRMCLDAPNFTVFSNTSSASQYNHENVINGKEQQLVIPLESPHNDMHLAMGGYDVPSGPQNVNPDPSSTVAGGPNGDMGENDTASFDPIFFFHHCYVDRMFWLWQQKHEQTSELMIEPEYARYPGTNNFDGQGPTPGRQAGSWLDLETPLEPFMQPDGTFLTSSGVVDIEGQLGYTYGPGSFSNEHGNLGNSLDLPQISAPPDNFLAVSGISRSVIRGSFAISTWANDAGDAGEKRLLDMHSVLSRWHTSGCANCQTHLDVKMFVPLHGVQLPRKVEVLVHTHDDLAGAGKESHPRLRAVPVANER